MIIHWYSIITHFGIHFIEALSPSAWQKCVEQGPYFIMCWGPVPQFETYLVFHLCISCFIKMHDEWKYRFQKVINNHWLVFSGTEHLVEVLDKLSSTSVDFFVHSGSLSNLKKSTEVDESLSKTSTRCSVPENTNQLPRLIQKNEKSTSNQ